MNDIPNPKQVAAIKTQYPRDSRVRVDSVDDPYTTIPPGTEGIVIVVEDVYKRQVLASSPCRFRL